jgi:FAD-dependent urate hydroxylase
VAIVGGGIGGLTAALALARYGHHPLVLEQTHTVRPIGAGISLWPNGVKVLNLLGLGEKLDKIGGHMERMAYADRSGRSLADFSLQPLYRRVGEQARPLARADLQDVLLEAAAATATVRLGARVMRVDQDGDGVALHVERVGADGSASPAPPVRADLVVAADGTHSSLRGYVLGEQVARRYVGYVNWNGLVAEPPRLVRPGTWLTWVGDNRRASVMPVGGRRCYAWFDVPMPLEQAMSGRASLDELAREFTGWAPEVAQLIAMFTPEGVARIPVHDTDPLACWARGRVALLGDAAHTLAPDLGQGGCQAIEDAWALAQQLTATSISVEDALARYEAGRKPHTAHMTTRARRRAAVIHGADGATTAEWYRSLEGDSPDTIIDGLAQSVEAGVLG